MVAQNGDFFDMRWYNGRHLIHGLEPIPWGKTVDTYKIAKRYFNLNSYRLDYLGKLLFGNGCLLAVSPLVALPTWMVSTA